MPWTRFVFVIPAKAGIHLHPVGGMKMDPGLRRGDERRAGVTEVMPPGYSLRR
jgi:hypothetical protein